MTVVTNVSEDFRYRLALLWLGFGSNNNRTKKEYRRTLIH